MLHNVALTLLVGRQEEHPEWFTFLVPVYPGCPGKKAVKCMCMCVCVLKLLQCEVLLSVEYMYDICQ